MRTLSTERFEFG